jgi:GNAT superfamily N-acetyltransferase
MDKLNTPALREAATADIPAALAVLHTAFEEYQGRLDPPSRVHRETVESLAGAMAAGRLILAELDATLVGCVLYHAELDHIYFGRLAVLPAYRRRGVAGVLIAYVEQRGRELNLPCVRLGVRVGLPELRDRYQRLGYRQVEARQHEGYAEPTYLIMEKPLVR